MNPSFKPFLPRKEGKFSSELWFAYHPLNRYGPSSFPSHHHLNLGWPEFDQNSEVGPRQRCQARDCEVRGSKDRDAEAMDSDIGGVRAPQLQTPPLS